MSNRGGQQSELGLMLPTRPPGETTGITLTEDEQAAAQLYVLESMLQGSAGAMSPLTAQQQAAIYAAGGSGNSGNVVFNSPTSLVNRRNPAADDGKCVRSSSHQCLKCYRAYEIDRLKCCRDFGVNHRMPQIGS